MRVRSLLMLVCVWVGCSSNDSGAEPGAMAGTGVPPMAGGGAGGTSGAGDAPIGGASGAMSGAGGASGAMSGAGGASAGTGASGGSGGSTTDVDASVDDAAMPMSGECTRENLSALVDQFFTALSANDASSLPIAASAKITENGEAIALSEGLWSGAGEVAFKHSALDTENCSSVTEAVIADGSSDIPIGVRLKLESAEITEIEMIVVRSGDYFVSSDTDFIIESANDDWLELALIPEADRSTRQELIELVDVYFSRFPAGGCNFADDCVRLENGFSPGGCALGLSCSTSGMGSGGMTASRHVIDVEAGIAVGFVMFAGSYTDFHMFKVYRGEVHGVHAVLAEAAQSGWD